MDGGRRHPRQLVRNGDLMGSRSKYSKHWYVDEWVCPPLVKNGRIKATGMYEFPPPPRVQAVRPRHVQHNKHRRGRGRKRAAKAEGRRG